MGGGWGADELEHFDAAEELEVGTRRHWVQPRRPVAGDGATAATLRMGPER